MLRGSDKSYMQEAAGPRDLLLQKGLENQDHKGFCYYVEKLYASGPHKSYLVFIEPNHI